MSEKKTQKEETVVKEKPMPRVLVISLEDDDEFKTKVVEECPFFKGEFFEHVVLSGMMGVTAKDWQAKPWQEFLEESAKFISTELLPRNAVSVQWLSSPEIVRAKSDETISGFVLASDVVSTMKMKVFTKDVPSFPKNHFLDLILRFLG